MKHGFFRKLFGDFKYALFLNRMEVFPVRNLYKVGRPKVEILDREIVLMFDGKIYNTGLADRLRAICSVYTFCKENNIKFKLHFIAPFDLSDYLLPNAYDWSISNTSLSYNPKISDVRGLISFNGVFGETVNCELHRKILKEICMSDKKQIHLYSNTYCYDQFFFESFHELFKLSDSLEGEISLILEKLEHNYISISFRFAQLLGDLKDTFGTPLSDVSKQVLIEKCMNAINVIMSENAAIKWVFVTSDSKTFLERAKQLSNVFILSGNVGHIVSQSDNEVVKRTFLDMFLIARAKKAYMVRSSQMFKSGFAKRAALLGNVVFEERIV